MPDTPIISWTTFEREYRIYEDRIYKRSLRPEEYRLDTRNELYVPALGPERIQNETACLQFIQSNTNIPVPAIIEAYEERGSFVLVTKRLLGVQMDELSPQEQTVVMKEVERYLEALRTLRSNRTGGPSGIICPPKRATQYFSNNVVWSAKVSKDRDFVFCHGDLSQSNIIVNPKTLKIEGFIDWEYGGFWPEIFESHYFLDPQPSGAQFRSEKENLPLIDFLTGMAASEQ